MIEVIAKHCMSLPVSEGNVYDCSNFCFGLTVVSTFPSIVGSLLFVLFNNTV